MSRSHYQPNQEQLLGLISRCAIQDQAAFEALYQEASGPILGVLMQMLPDRSTAEDCLQEAFLQIWHKADQYHQGKGSVFGWMVTIARYRAIDCIRKARPTVELDETQIGLADIPAFSGDEKRLQECLAQLPPDSAELILKSFVAGYTQSELSTSSQTPLGTVKSWIRRGLALLKQCLTHD